MERSPAKRPPAYWMTAAWVSRALGPVLALCVYAWLPAGESGLSDAGRATAGIGCLMAVFWMGEALPLAVTALLPIVLFPLAGVASIRDAAAVLSR